MVRVRTLFLIASACTFAALAETALANDACRDCHPQAVAGYLATGMGNSISRPVHGLKGSFDHELSQSSFSISRTDTGMAQSVQRGGLTAEYPIEYIIGSGNAALGFLVRVDDYVYQSPVSYYAKRRRWDMAPGFELHPAPDFDRPVLNECLWCHAGRPKPVPFTQNRYRDPVLELEVISCDRCHGPTERHLESPSSETIVNPAKLPPSERDSVCEQCHLGGEERVLNPGRTFGDFQPGMQLEDVFSVYVEDFGMAEVGRFKVVSHAEQLSLSKCYEASGERMWCGTCHSPHQKPENPPAYYRARCLECHGEALVSRHSEPVDDCVSCHMIRRPSYDSGHSAFTDHLIARLPRSSSEPGRDSERVRAWRDPGDPGLAQRNLGLAYVRLGERKSREDYMDEGASLLAQLVQIDALDPEGLAALGGVLLSKKAPPEAGLKELAAELLQRAMLEAPVIPERYRMVAAAEWQAGNTSRAIDLLERAIELDPQNRAAYQILSRIHQESGRRREAIQAWSRYLELIPQSVSARKALQELGQGVKDGEP